MGSCEYNLSRFTLCIPTPNIFWSKNSTRFVNILCEVVINRLQEIVNKPHTQQKFCCVCSLACLLKVCCARLDNHIVHAKIFHQGLDQLCTLNVLHYNLSIYFYNSLALDRQGRVTEWYCYKYRSWEQSKINTHIKGCKPFP